MANSTDITLIVGGFDELASALDSSGCFASTIRLETTGSLRELIKNRSFPRDQARVVFLFASSLKVDTSESLEYLVGRLSAAGWKVVVLATSPSGRSIVDAHPAAGYLESPFTINQVMGALAGLGFAGIDPVEGGHAPITKSSPPSTATPAAPVSGAWKSADAASQPSAPSGGAWTRPAPTQPAQPVQPPRTAPVPQAVQAPKPQAPVTPKPVSQPVAQPTPPKPTTTPGPWSTTAPTTHNPPTQAAPPRTLARPASQAPSTAASTSPIARPAADGHLVRRVGTYQDFAPTAQSARRRGFVITVTSPKGGTGKSSLSANLAAYLGLSLRNSGRRVALVDANFQQADTGKLLGAYTPNISNILKDESSLVPERIEQYMIDRRDLNTSFLLGPATPRDASPSFFNSRLYNQVVAVLKQNFDYIIIDTPVAELYHEILRNFALPCADYIVVPITPAIHTLMNADSWLRTITLPRHQGGDEIDPGKIGIVLNQAQEGVDCDEEEVRAELYAWNFIGSIPLTKEWLRANNNNDFIATKPIPELSEAFANILHAATGEELLLQGFVSAQGPGKKGLLSRLRRQK